MPHPNLPAPAPGALDTEVLIVGAGPAGLALGIALTDQGLAVTLLEQQATAAVQAPAEDGREIALTHRSRRLMQELGLWRHLPCAEVAPLWQARVIDGSSPRVLQFGASRRDGDPLGWLVPNHRIRQAAWLAAAERPSLQVLTQARVAAITRGPRRATVTLDDGRHVSARLVVAADSRHSSTRRLAGIGALMHDFGRSVVVGRVQHEADHEGVAWECFRYGNTLALLPLNGRRASAVVTVAADQASDWLGLSGPDFAARIQAQSEGRLGAMQALGPRHHYPLLAVYAQAFAGPRLALVGDAAVGMHPVTAHGWNFGLYGVQVLARELSAVHRQGGDVGHPAALQAYAREHRHTTWPVWLGTNAVVSLFTDERPLPKLARRVMLAAAARAPGLSQLLKAGIERRLTDGGRTARA
jgi:ubiquinone biosynthesis UbiH/UbiF/VisC/COQ6 family hydroxylase